ncbi:hypothetical protein LDENG_00023670 [Lucifuga dentata]|nr:hypothetical protein LDENG_00023670 [Lucifuga dentata]
MESCLLLKLANKGPFWGPPALGVCQGVILHVRGEGPLNKERVHCSLHLAVNQTYLRRLRHREKEKEKGYDLYAKLQRDREGTLCSPYPENPFDS